MSNEHNELAENEIGDEYNLEHVKTRIKRNKQERHVRKTNMWLRRLRMLLRFLFILFLIFLCYKIIRMKQWYMSPRAFDNIDSPYLEITNNKIVSNYYILAALRKSEVPKVPIYMYNTDEIRDNLSSLPPIENVFIRRFWFPARLQIIIQEDTPTITIAPDEKVEPIAFFTKNGKLIGRDYLPLDKSFQTIKILTYGTKGDDYRHWDLQKLESIEKLAKAIKAGTKNSLEYIDMRVPNDIYIQLKDIRIRLGELDDSAVERVQRLPSIMPQVQTLDKKIKYIDLRWKDTNYIKLEE